MRLLPATLLFTALLSIPGVAPARGQDGRSELERLKIRYEASQGIVARFEQTSEVLGETDVLTGSLYLRGDGYRLETGSRTITTDGSTIWVYDATERQVVVSEYIEDETTFSIPGFLHRFDDRWTVDSAVNTTVGGEPVTAVTLVPIDTFDYFTRVVAHLRKRDAMIVRIEVTDASDVTMVFVLRDVREQPLDDSLFRFKAPDGVEVVDLRS